MFSYRKGITPVVAIVLLIAITVGAGGTMYSIIVDTQNNVQNPEEQLNLNPDSVEFESCWGSPSNPSFSIRNTGPEAINASEIPVTVNTTSLNQSDGDYIVPNPIVDPGATFTLVISNPTPINQDSIIALILEGEAIEYQCRNLN